MTLHPSFISPVGIYSSLSGSGVECNVSLPDRFYETMIEKRSDPQTVRLDFHGVDESCWLHTAGVCLSVLP